MDTEVPREMGEKETGKVPIMTGKCERCGSEEGREYAYAKIRDTRLTWRFPIKFRMNAAGYLTRTYCDECIVEADMIDINHVYVLLEKIQDVDTKHPWVSSENWNDHVEPFLSKYYHDLLEEKKEALEYNGIYIDRYRVDDLKGFDQVWFGMRCEFGRDVFHCPACDEGISQVSRLLNAIKKGDVIDHFTSRKGCPFIQKRCDLRDEIVDQISKLERIMHRNG